MRYSIQRTDEPDQLSSAWESFPWRDAAVLSIDQFHPESSDHRPRTRAKLLYTSDALLAIFYRGNRLEPESLAACLAGLDAGPPGPRPQRLKPVFRLDGQIDCLFFVQVITNQNGQGNLVAFGQDSWRVVLQEERLEHHDFLLGHANAAEIESPVDWSLALRIPFAMMEPYVGAIPDVTGQSWRGNLFKCGDQTSHPHWASWAPIGEELNFHQPEKFGELVFDLV